MWMMTFFLYTAFVLQLILIPIRASDAWENKKVQSLIPRIRVGGILMFIVTILVLMLEFFFDWLGMDFGVFSGGVIPLIVGIGSGLIGANLIWLRQARTFPPSSD
jgi:hypothetical protein